jgi:SAM-dependent methyltransferase
MQLRLLDILVCSKCKVSLTGVDFELDGKGEIDRGSLKCMQCNAVYPILAGIPRFVEADNYAASFGYQWNLFRKEQIDSYNGTTLSADRLWTETGWQAADLKDKWVLDAGCGAGRFLDAASVSGGEIVGIDISSAIDAAKDNLSGRKNVHFVQASIYDLPFRDSTFDFCYCIGVIQHTPEPERSLRSIAATVRPEGEIAVTIYPRKPWTKLFAKYWLRPITKRMGKEKLLKAIQVVMPVAFPITDVLFRFPLLGKVFMFAIPVANYVHEKQLDRDQRYSWAILDTFDMLSPHFDQPMTDAEAAKALREAGVGELSCPTKSGLNIVGKRGAV